MIAETDEIFYEDFNGLKIGHALFSVFEEFKTLHWGKLLNIILSNFSLKQKKNSAIT